MTDGELAWNLKQYAENEGKADPELLYAASERLYALSAHVALLKASLAKAEREACAKRLEVVAAEREAIMAVVDAKIAAAADFGVKGTLMHGYFASAFTHVLCSIKDAIRARYEKGGE